MLYDQPSNISGFGGIMDYLNTAMASNTPFTYVFSTGIILMVFFIMLIFFITKEKPEVAIATSGFVSTIITLLMIYAGLAGMYLLYMFILLTGVGVGYMYWNSKQQSI